jgi:hypothetical protein
LARLLQSLWHRITQATQEEKVTNRFAALQRHIASALAAVALSAFFIGAAVAPVSVQQSAGAEQQLVQA